MSSQILHITLYYTVRELLLEQIRHSLLLILQDPGPIADKTEKPDTPATVDSPAVSETSTSTPGRPKKGGKGKTPGRKGRKPGPKRYVK